MNKGIMGRYGGEGNERIPSRYRQCRRAAGAPQPAPMSRFIMLKQTFGSAGRLTVPEVFSFLWVKVTKHKMTQLARDGQNHRPESYRML